MTKTARKTLTLVDPPAKLAQPIMFLQIGRKRYQVADVQEAVRMYTEAREKSGLGASEMPRVTIVSEHGAHMYEVSYNGRVWDIDAKGNRVALDGMNSEQWVSHVTGGAHDGRRPLR